MRVLTWNVNGLASTLQYHPWSETKSFKVLLDTLASDILCFQEVKCQKSKLTRDMAVIPGYHAYFSCSKVKLGYSGVVTYVKDTLIPIRTYEGITGILDESPQEFKYDLGTPALTLDAEGRCVILDFGFFVVLNIYFPNESNETRTEFKMDYHACVEKRIQFFLKEGKQVILVGDINAVHEAIDHCDPKQSMKDHDITDFKDLPHRRWLDNILGEQGLLIDMTRLYHPERKKMFTCWNTKINARPANHGTRIDMILPTKGLQPYFKYSDIQSDVMGSDHCPVYADFTDDLIEKYNIARQDHPTVYKSPILSTHFPQFSNDQKKMSSYFTKASSSLPPTPIEKRPAVQTLTPPQINLKRIKTNGKTPQKSLDSFFQTNNNNKKAIEEDDIDIDQLISEVKTKETATKAWHSLFIPPEVPKCKVHQEPCLERTVTKKGVNMGRVFYICSKPKGPKEESNFQFSCDYFQWKK